MKKRKKCDYNEDKVDSGETNFIVQVRKIILNIQRQGKEKLSRAGKDLSFLDNLIISTENWHRDTIVPHYINQIATRLFAFITL